MIKKTFKRLGNYINMNYRGVTLLELAATMLISVTLIGTAAYYQEGMISKAKASALKQTLTETRKAIDAYYAASLPKKYPRLEELVPNYLRNIPVDPVTQSNLWVIVKEDATTCLSNDIYTGACDIKSTDPQFINF